MEKSVRDHSSEYFFRQLTAKPMRTGLLDPAHYRPLPDDWTVVIADIIGSTRAVAEGRYKDVNTLSSCAIVAVLNRVGRERIAYIYGGDGATFAIPSALRFEVASALYGVQRLAGEEYALGLRVGMVKVAELRAEGHEVLIAKLETRPGAMQAALGGGGMARAEALVKDAREGTKYAIAALFDPAELSQVPPSFEGFECRWKPLASRNGVNLSLLVSARGGGADAIETYRTILARIYELCGDEEFWRPVSAGQLSISANPKDYMQEIKARAYGRGMAARASCWLRTTLITWAGTICVRFGWRMGAFDGAGYIAQVAENTDYLKFENALKIVMDVSRETKSELEEFLRALHQGGLIHYGMHESEAAMMTCLVFSHDDDHLHFVDGANGGYTMAAKALKAQIKAGSGVPG